MVECARCGRKLKDPKSIENGMGKVCKRKSIASKAMAEKRSEADREQSQVTNESRD